MALIQFSVAGTTTPAGLPASGEITSVTAGIGTSLGSGNSIASRYGRRTLVDGDTDLGDWTSGTPGADWTAIVVIYRNQHASTPIGKIGTSQAGSSNVVTFPAVAAPLNGSNSWIVTGAIRNNEGAGMEVAPTGHVNRDFRNGAEPKAGLYDSNGIVSSYASDTETYGNAAGAWLGMAMEIQAADSLGLVVVATLVSSGTTMPGTVSLPAQSPGRGFANRRELAEIVRWESEERRRMLALAHREEMRRAA